MRPYTKILTWENERRLNRLIGFRDNVVTYFKNCTFNRFEYEPEENEVAQRARIDINKELGKVHNIMAAAGVYPVLVWTPPPAIGGLVQQIDIVLNMF